MPHGQSQKFEFFGSATYWGQNYERSATPFFNRCVITPESITIRTNYRIHVHKKENIAELRWVSFPISKAIMISRESAVIWSAFVAFRPSRLRLALLQCGYQFTSESRWSSGRGERIDAAKYELPVNDG